jgi:hypothetical protein
MRSLILVGLIAVACAGSEGKAGLQGPTGPSGPAGVTGPGLAVTSAKFCEASSTQIGGRPIHYAYQVVVYSNGDKFLLCGLTDTASSVSWERYCPAGADCNAAAICRFVYDVEGAPGNSGTMEFRNDGSLGERVTYHDTASAYDGYGIGFAAPACT